MTAPIALEARDDPTATMSRPAVGAVVTDVGGRLAAADTLARATQRAPVQSGFPDAVRWWSPGLAQGDAGLAVLLGALDAAYPGDGWDRLGHRHLDVAARAAAASPGMTPSLFCGTAGLGAAALALSRGGQRYRRLLATVDAAVVGAVPVLTGRLAGVHGCAVRDFDVISGLSGIGAYLLTRSRPTTEPALTQLLTSLAELLTPEDGPPRWHTPGPLLETLDQRVRHPQGNLNCGLAHGLPGPLALLALAALEGRRSDRGDVAIDAAAGWLCDHHVVDAWGVNWPDAVPLGEGPPGPLGRPTWCYGAPGIARAIWLAGQALDDDSYRSFAVRAMTDAVAKPVTVRGLSSVTYCHGTAGLLHVSAVFARDTGLPVFREATERLFAEVLAAHDPATLLGYVCTEPDGRRVDQAGLLDGAAGVALALLAAGSPSRTLADRLFLLG